MRDDVYVFRSSKVDADSLRTPPPISRHNYDSPPGHEYKETANVIAARNLRTAETRADLFMLPMFRLFSMKLISGKKLLFETHNEGDEAVDTLVSRFTVLTATDTRPGYSRQNPMVFVRNQILNTHSAATLTTSTHLYQGTPAICSLMTALQVVLSSFHDVLTEDLKRFIQLIHAADLVWPPTQDTPDAHAESDEVDFIDLKIVDDRYAAMFKSIEEHNTRFRTPAFFMYGRCDLLIMALLMGGLKDQLRVGYAPLMTTVEGDTAKIYDLLKNKNIELENLEMESFAADSFTPSKKDDCDVVLVDYEFGDDSHINFDEDTVQSYVDVPVKGGEVIAIVFKINGFYNGKPLPYNHYVSWIDDTWHDPAIREIGRAHV